MSAWEALVELDRGRGALGEQLTAALRVALTQGRLAPGTRLPSSRDLAGDLGLSRGVVVNAYEQLVAEGRLLSRRGSGTVVASVAPVSPPATLAIRPARAGPATERPAQGGPAVDGPEQGRPATERPAQGRPAVDGPERGRPASGPTASSRPAARPPASASDHGAHRGRNAVAPLRPGVPDLGSFPRARWRRAYERALAAAYDADLDYGDPAGAPRLRAELAGYLGRVRAARVEPSAVVVTTGAAQAFSLLAGVLRATGVNEIGFEEPGSAGVRTHLDGQGLRPVAIPVDAGGLDVAALAHSRLRAVLVTPAHQFPTGVVLAPARRAALLAWAARTGGIVIEDDYDAEFRYDREPVGCLQGLAPDTVVLIGSASKALAPGARLGWMAVPAPLRAAVTSAKAAADLGGPVLEQLAFAELLGTGDYDRHLRRARRLHRRRRDALVAALARYLPAARISGVAAGLHLVVELPVGVDDADLAARARAAGLAPVPLSELRLAPGGPGGLVLGYAAHGPDELAGAVRTLATLLPAGG